MNQKLPTISSTLRKWLLLGTMVVFVLFMALSVFVEYRVEKKDAEALLRLTIQDVTNDIRRVSDENLLRLTYRIASVYESEEHEGLEHLMTLYNVSEINVIDAQGIIVETTDARFRGYDMRSGEQSAMFLTLLDGVETLVQPLGPMSYDDATLRKYAGVALEGGGFIQVGYSESQFQAEMEETIQDITGYRHVLEKGLVFILDSDMQLVSLRSDLPGTVIRKMFSEGNRLGKPNTMTVIEEDGLRGYWMYDTLDGYSIVAVVSVREALQSVFVSAAMFAAMGAALSALLYLGISLLVRRVVVRPVHAVADGLSAIAGDNLDRRLDVRDTLEFAVITDGVNATVDALKGHIAREAARIDEELAYARRIQESALPVLTDTFTANPAFALFASMVTAREVGGDFYDFYMLNDHSLAFLIADVSGKGIPAAMFMMTGKTTLRDCAENTGDIGQAMARANDKLYEGNEAGMFITAWMGILDITTGAVRFADAGHNPPVLIRNGEARYLDMTCDLILGIMDGGEYESQSLALQAGDLLFLYTDGVTEATDAEQKLYGEKRLLDTLNGITPEGGDICQEVCSRVKTSLDAFVGGAPQADDITMLCLYYRG